MPEASSFNETTWIKVGNWMERKENSGVMSPKKIMPLLSRQLTEQMPSVEATMEQQQPTTAAADLSGYDPVQVALMKETIVVVDENDKVLQQDSKANCKSCFFFCYVLGRSHSCTNRPPDEQHRARPAASGLQRVFVQPREQAAASTACRVQDYLPDAVDKHVLLAPTLPRRRARYGQQHGRQESGAEETIPGAGDHARAGATGPVPLSHAHPLQGSVAGWRMGRARE